MDEKFLLGTYRDMVRLRSFEEVCVELKYQDVIMDGYHPYHGQEAVAVGVCRALEEDDYLLSTHRPQGHILAKGGNPEKILAEMSGRIGGVCKGKAGPMNFCDWDNHFLCTSIVASGIPLSTGIGLAIKAESKKDIVVSFLGDGAINTGAFHEGVNLASVWELPVLFVCENNQYGEATPISKVVRIENLSQRAENYGIEGKTIDGNDVLAVYQAALEFVEEIRKGHGPKFLEAVTYRFRGHYEGEPEETYRSKEEVDGWKRKCPILRFRKHILKNGISSEEELSEIENEAKKEMEEAKSRVLTQAFPSFGSLVRDVYTEVPE